MRMKMLPRQDAMAALRFPVVIGMGLTLLGCASPSPAVSPARPAVAEAGGHAPVPAERPSHARPDFSGHWKLDAKASDDPLEKAREATQAARQASGGGRGMGRGGGMGGKRQGRGASAGMDGGGLPSGELAALLAPLAELHITQQDPMLLIADENDRHQRLYTDFRGASVSASGGLRQRVSIAGWEGGTLVVESTMLGGKLTQRYQIDETGQLVIASVAQVSGARPVSYRLVYGRMPPGAALASRGSAEGQ